MKFKLKMNSNNIAILLCIGFSILAKISFSQNAVSCGQEIIMQQIRQNNPSVFDEAENKFNKYIQSVNNLKPKSGNAAGRFMDNGSDYYIIPVVVHIIHNGEQLGTGTNISYAQIRSQIDALNAAFSNYDPSANYLQNNVSSQYNNPARRGPNGVDTRIRFCLAGNLGTISPNGIHSTNEPGVIRYNNTTVSSNHISQSGQLTLMNLTNPGSGILSSQNYFNIWVLTSINSSIPGVEGYAPIPVDAPYVSNGNWPLRGVVIRSDVFGDNTVNNNNFLLQPRINPSAGGGNNEFNFSAGKILVHEIGHALGLYHTFHVYSQNGTDACNTIYGDLVADTPPSNIDGLPTYKGIGTRNTCNENPDKPDMVENYMYYSTDNVSNTFTAEQTQRMQNTINLAYPVLCSELNLLQTGIFGNSGCFPSILSAVFSYPSNICTGQSIAFSGIQGNGNLATTWKWSVVPNSGVVISNINSATTNISFPITGNYQVSLTVTGNNQSDTFTQTIFTSACNLNECALANGNTKAFVGAYVLLDFASGSPVVSSPYTGPNAFWSAESAFTQCDKNGNLLFTTNGVKVWDKNNNVYVLGTPDNQLSSMEIIGVPFPGHPNKYVIFLPPTGEVYNYDFIHYKLLSYVIEVTSTGLIISNPTIIPFPSDYNYPSESITAVPHCNGKDYWIIIPFEGLYNRKSNIITYLLNESGIKLTSSLLITQPGLLWGTGIKSNRVGNKLITRLAIFDFNNTTGLVTLKNTIPDTSFYFFQLYSADGMFLFRNFSTKIEIWNSGNPTPFQTSNLTRYQTIQGSFPSGYKGFFLGPDDEVYLKSNGGLSRLNHTGNSFTLSTMNANLLSSIPDAVDACKPDYADVDFTIKKTSCNTINVNLTGCYNQYNIVINWGDGSAPLTGLFSSLAPQTLTHNYNQAGNYSISATLSITSQWDTNGDSILDNNTISLTPVIKQVIITPTISSIEGSDSVCVHSLPLQYVFNAGLTGNYTWSVTGFNNQIIGPANGIGLNSVNIIWNNSGTVKVSYQEGSCNIDKNMQVGLLSDCGNIISSIGSVFKKSDILLFPNPVHDILIFQGKEKIFEIDIIDATGRLVNTQQIINNQADMKELSNGTYIIRSKTLKDIYYFKIIKI